MKKWKQSATHSHTRNSVEVSGQVYTTTPSPAEPVIPQPLEYSLQRRFGRFGKRRISFPCRESKRDSCEVICTLLAILPELWWLNREHVLDTKRCSKLLSLQSLLFAMCARLAQSLVSMPYTCSFTVAFWTFSEAVTSPLTGYRYSCLFT